MRFSTDKTRDLCRRRGLTLQELLKKAGVSRTAYYSLSRRENLLPGTLQKVARALGVTSRALLLWDEERLQRLRRLAAETDEILGKHPEADRDNVWHTLLLLEENPWKRLNRGLLRARTIALQR
ncbi:MAG TPA: helix-turn-helix transcriptional regulator [bacterium]|nr:helix-turn-helix transcriptional regulator [bacterium]